MENGYLIPANTKKAALIFGLFTYLDMIVLGSGITIAFICLLFVGTTSDLTTLILALSPALISASLVMPLPYYHNILTLCGSLISYFTNRRKYIWKGWDYNEKYR